MRAGCTEGRCPLYGLADHLLCHVIGFLFVFISWLANGEPGLKGRILLVLKGRRNRADRWGILLALCAQRMCRGVLSGR